MDIKDLMLLVLLEEETDYEEMVAIRRRGAAKHDLYKRRREEGCFRILIKELLKANEEKFRQFFRLNSSQFDFVLNLVQEDLRKKGSDLVKQPISPNEKLALTLRFLATGESFRSLAFAFRISSSCISVIVRDTLEAICRHLVPLFLPPPTINDLQKKAKDFWTKWNFPNCVCAIDGKHVRIFCPKKRGSLFFNYKGHFSIVLLAMIDADCKFLAVDVGSYGKEGDSGIFVKSSMGKQVFSDKFFPPDETLTGSNKHLPFVIVGDEAFRLHRHIMKPYTKTSARLSKEKSILNYRLTRARRVSKNAFGLLCQVFRIFYTSIAVKPDICDKLIIAACYLHNLLRERYLENNERPFYEYDRNLDSLTNVSSLTRTGGYVRADGFKVRESFTNFFSHEGVLDWQDSRISRISSEP